ncbi:TonB-dependent receptor [Aestuariibacter sp. A3R04]|uniref:TonB-dependent receptor n=1 Tax=Aestuariibacter sp. A3R04 TaxID=2841571 RepID=UPI001C093ACF|nr:TonB-dependent receptor [Aestuariibacter sp. A3R04]MBU3021805.1 TonB-dependent receptor [Aestuariibacter sp. A3R04]
MKQFKPNLIKAALISGGMAFGSSPVFAQDANTDAPEDAELEVIQVSGIRGSLQRAQAIKMNNTSIVEALSAEDIGKLPDTSVAESLARLPGLAGERRNGRTSGLSVRGFNENYVGTTLNGRELLGMGDNRGVEFDLYPTEIVSNILVYKTPEAGLMTQGIGGTIDIQTVSPLTAKKTMAINANYEVNQEESGNPDFDNKGHRVSFNFVDQFANDTIGVALAIADMESPRQEQHFRGWGYADADGSKAADGVEVPEGTVILGGHDSFTRSAMLERTSIAGVIEYAPNEDLKIQLDALYIDFEENDVRRGVEEGGAAWGTQDYTITGVDNGLVTSGYYDGYLSVIRNDSRQQKAELTTFGLNAEYIVNEDWTATLDVSSGKVDKTITDIESYSGVGRAGVDGRPLTPRAWTMTSTGVVYSDHPTLDSVDLADPTLVRLAGPQAWGGSLGPVERFQGVEGFGPNTAQDGFVNEPVFDETLDAIRLDVKGYVDWGIFTKLTAGVNYQEREKQKDNNGAYLTSPVWPDADPIPNPLGTADLSFIGIEGVVAYDGLALYRDGYYIETEAELFENGRLGDSYTIKEEILTTYAKLDIDTEIGDVLVFGNLGLQVISVDQTGDGFNTTTGPTGFTSITPISDGDAYTDVLPTLNLSFEVAENQFIRTALGKVLSRPRMDDMRPNNTVSFTFNDQQIVSTNVANGPWSASAGNARLKPLEANQFDIAYENYFADSGYFAVSFFYKDLTNWHIAGQTIGDFSGSYIEGFHQTSGQTDINGDGVADENDIVPPGTFNGVVSFREDGLEGFVRGWELQGSLPLDIIHDSLEGFGVFASATFLDGQFDNGDAVPGLSEESYSFTAFYESNGFEVRVSGTKRDPFSTETRAISLSLAQIDDRGGEQWDAQIGYDFSESGIESLEGLRITLQGQNLTDEPTVQANPGDGRQITQYQQFGRNFLLGVNYTF